ncbi:valine--tRNA ligase [Candidatus Uhrbacteria bacterium]|nr:valine--tRNA ligase [Candidatus Uhrbacteria bacterium]
MDEFLKAYEPQKVEDGISAKWLESGYFTPENLPPVAGKARTEPFCIVLPPPNVTGTLHMGHATMLAIEDAMVRFARLRGKKTLWLPGTDHAAIATQSKVESILFKEEGKTRHDLGREAFLQRVEAFAQHSHDTIVNQCKKMGSSLDWTREAFTLDAARNRAVNAAFKTMYDDGLIYRGYRVVNWDPVGQTTIADDEVVYKEAETTLYTFRYGKDFPIAVSTTRPETKVGDTAVAVHPDDKRYKKFVGKTFDVAFAGAALSITVVADESVDKEFGTGALGVTPAHSAIDAGIAERHGLGMTQVIGEDARMLPAAGGLVAGMTTKEARTAVVEWLRGEGLLEGEEKTMQNLSTAERSGGVIEPLPKMQWFVAVNKEFMRDGKAVTLKSLMQDAVRSKAVAILPDRFEKTYFHWIDNLRDWNISRQIWYGHRVPVWYRGEEVAVGEAPSGDGWEQDPDTLDTWFSSGLWTFSTLGWPEATDDLKTFHPTSVLETGYDIIFFWVARMILMSTYLMDEVPFTTVYLHGLVRDEQGRKMSKSLDNIINPLDMIEKYGADATRLSLVIGSTPGNDLKLSEEKIAGFRNFTNKLWNISRFVDMTTGGLRHVDSVAPTTLADRWILGRFAEVIAKATAYHETYQLSLAGELLRDFTWGDFADWYLEIAKVEKGKDDILCFILERLLILWHPFMPFVTEEIYRRFNAGMCIVAEWPEADAVPSLGEADAAQFETLQDVIGAIRNIRAEYKVEPKRLVDVVVSDPTLLAYTEVINALGRVRNLATGDRPAQAASAVVGTVQVHVSLEGLVDTARERARLSDELESTVSYIRVQEEKLANKDFVKRAPEKVIEGERKKLEDAKTKAEKLEYQLASLQ